MGSSGQGVVGLHFVNSKVEAKQDQNVSDSFHAREPNETTMMKQRPTTSVRMATKSHSFNSSSGLQQMGVTGGNFKFGQRQVLNNRINDTNQMQQMQQTLQPNSNQNLEQIQQSQNQMANINNQAENLAQKLQVSQKNNAGKENVAYPSSTNNTKHYQIKVQSNNNVRMNSSNRQQLAATGDAMSSDIAFDTSSEQILQSDPANNCNIDAEMSCIDMDDKIIGHGEHNVLLE